MESNKFTQKVSKIKQAVEARDLQQCFDGDANNLGCGAGFCVTGCCLCSDNPDSSYCDDAIGSASACAIGSDRTVIDIGQKCPVLN